MLTELILALTAFPQQPPIEPAYLRVIAHGRTDLAEHLIRAGFDAEPRPGINPDSASAEVILAEAELPRLRRLTGNAPLILERSRPFREIFAARQRLAGPAAPPDPNYRTPAEIAADLLKLQSKFPKLARRYDLTQRYRVAPSHENRHIYGLRISDNPGSDEDEPAVLLQAEHHARELNTPEIVFWSATRLLEDYARDAAIRRLVDGNEIWIVPTMNPDGLNHVWTRNNLWRKNRRNNGGGVFGVDLNRNYPHFWSRCGSSNSPRSDVYHGPSAASEPETKLMLAFGRAEVFERVLDIHSSGRDVRWPYNRLTGPRLPPAFKRYSDAFQNEVARAMSYRLNSSCCCGGHQHWHLAEYGAIAFLVEMGTSQQPPYSSTQAEVRRMWPGVRAFFDKPVPLRGHVRSLAGNKPLAAEITAIGHPFRDGQKRRSSARHGRYFVWLGAGTYTLEFRAPGHEPKRITSTLREDRTQVRDVVLTPTLRPTTLTARGAPKLGQRVSLDIASPDDPGRDYFVGVAGSRTPAIRVGPRKIDLAFDALFANALSLPTVFVNFAGTLDARGGATATLVVPGIPVLAGLDLHFAALTLAPGWPLQIKGISATRTLRLQR